MNIGITERGDAALNTTWSHWVLDKKPAILISKNPGLLATHLEHIEAPNVIVHATITGYGCSILEPNVVDTTEAMKGLKRLSELLGPERVVLRVDPVIPTYKGIQTAIKVLKQANKIGKFRVRISFIDNYPHVIQRFTAEDIALPWSSFHAPLELRKQAFQELQSNTESIIEVCSEPDFACFGCVSEKDCLILGVCPSQYDGFQRPLCNCNALKTELLFNKNPCAHNCLYCYWKNKAIVYTGGI